MGDLMQLIKKAESGKTIVVFPYGECGRSVSMYLDRLGIDNYLCCDNHPVDNTVLRPEQLKIDSSDICVLLSVLDKRNYTMLYKQIEETLPQADIFDALKICSYGRYETFNMLNLDRKINDLIGRFGFNQMGGRIDYRLTRLEMLLYYQNHEKFELLDDEQKEILKYLNEDYLRELPRKFFKENYKISNSSSNKKENENVIIKKDDKGFFWEIDGKKIYLSGKYEDARRIAEGLYNEFFTLDHPHNYFDLYEGYTIDSLPSDIVLCDVGAAEGLFSMLLIDKCKKIYLFENDIKWKATLEKTFTPYMDKVEIVPETIGDGYNGCRLDDFFKDKEKPTMIKMDIEGYEASALRGMTDLLSRKDELSLLICTYHRQEDWDQFYEVLDGCGFDISSSKGYFWNMPDPMPPFFRHGVMRAIRRK